MAQKSPKKTIKNEDRVKTGSILDRRFSSTTWQPWNRQEDHQGLYKQWFIKVCNLQVLNCTQEGSSWVLSQCED